MKPETTKIFVNDKPLQLLESGSEPENSSWKELTLNADSDINLLLMDIYNAEKSAAFFIRVDSTERTLERIRNSMPTVVAAGGLVWNGDGRLLMIYRRGKWDLPKGKLDPGEDLESAALREVSEETGVKGLSLNGKHSVMYYVFKDHNKLFLKEIHWYKMLCSDNAPLVPQAKEEITKAEWASWRDIHENMENTYSSIRDLLVSRLEKVILED